MLFPERFSQKLKSRAVCHGWTWGWFVMKAEGDRQAAAEIPCSNKWFMTAQRRWALTWFSSWVTLICSLRMDVRVASSFLMILSFFSSGLQKLLMLLVDDPNLLSFRSSSRRSISFSLCISLNWACISSSSPPLLLTACLSRAEGTPWWWWWWCSMEREPRSL